MASFDENDILELLKRYHHGQCTPEERADLAAWYNQLEGSDELLADIDFEKDKAEIFNNILKALPKKHKTIRLWPRIAIAASFLLVLGAGAIIWRSLTAVSLEQQEVLSKIKPGTVSATLTLANGKKILLSQATNGALAKQAGVIVKKLNNGQIVYQFLAGSPADSTQMNTLTTAKGETYQAILPDGSKIWLNSESSVTYPTSFAMTKQRKVSLTGEAYFEVAKDQVHPFVVTASDQIVRVLGTHFNIQNYADEHAILTTLLEGSVQVSSPGATKRLIPGQQSQNVNGRVAVSDNADTEAVVAWKDGYFKFDGDLESVMNTIARWYDIQIVYESRPGNEVTLGGKVSRSRKLSEVLGLLEKYGGGVHFELSGRKVIVTKE